VPKLDCVDTFRDQLPLLPDAEASLVLGLLCLAMVINGRASPRSLRLYHSVLEDLRQGDATFLNSSALLEDLALEFRDFGRPLRVSVSQAHPCCILYLFDLF
jgi:hypothetical protein